MTGSHQPRRHRLCIYTEGCYVAGLPCNRYCTAALRPDTANGLSPSTAMASPSSSKAADGLHPSPLSFSCSIYCYCTSRCSRTHGFIQKQVDMLILCLEILL